MQRRNLPHLELPRHHEAVGFHVARRVLKVKWKRPRARLIRLISVLKSLYNCLLRRLLLMERRNPNLQKLVKLLQPASFLAAGLFRRLLLLLLPLD